MSRLLSGYSIQEKINETSQSVLYRVVQVDTGALHIAKVLKTNVLHPGAVSLLKQEFELIKKISLDGVVKAYDLIDIDDSIGIILEDFNGISLHDLFYKKAMKLDEFFPIAISLADTFGKLHRDNIIHKDIKPSNILFNFQTGQVKVTDFGIAQFLSGNTDDMIRHQDIIGTLAYISPEQTGRINRTVDYRTDLYSLGITFFEFLTGKLPFHSSDPMEMIHAHIAKKPPFAHENNHDVPEILSRIVDKLIAKVPDDRYQNAFGLKYDLENCYRQYGERKSIQLFELGQMDVSLKFFIPQLLIDRDDALQQLLDSFLRAAQGGKEIVIIGGEQGVGKSALGAHFKKINSATAGFIVQGHYEQSVTNAPYSAVVQSFSELIRLILMESDEKLKEWKNEFTEVLGPLGRIIADLVPQFELITGKQPELPEVGHAETKNRFYTAIKNFITTFGKKNHPLVIFIDDIQWMDAESKELVERLCTDREIDHLLLVCMVREPEGTPVITSFETLFANHQNISMLRIIRLTNLGESSLAVYLSAIFKCSPEECRMLAQIVHKKTNGNPFFINELLLNLYNHQLIKQSLNETGDQSGAYRWQWDLESINTVTITENLVDLLIEKINRFDNTVRQVLIAASCVGPSFTADIAAALLGSTRETIVAGLNLAIAEDFLYRDKENYHFSHARLQTALYSLLSNTEKSHLHAKIGRLLLINTPESSLSDKILEITDQFNKGISEIINDNDRETVSRLNVLAGKKMMGVAAFNNAYEYFLQAIQLLPPDPWINRYPLAYESHFSLMRMEFALSKHDNAVQRANMIIDATGDENDRVAVYRYLMNYFMSTGDSPKATRIGLKAVRSLGYNKLPKKHSNLGMLVEYAKIKLYYAKIELDDILAFKPVPDKRTGSLLKLFEYIVITEAPWDVQFACLTIFHSYNYHFKTRLLTDGLALVIAQLTPVFMHFMKDLPLADRAYQFSLKLDERFPNPLNRPALYYTNYYYYAMWKFSLREGCELMKRCSQSALEIGDNQFYLVSVNNYFWNLLYAGESIDVIYEDMNRYESMARDTQNHTALQSFWLIEQLYHCLKGKPNALSGEDADTMAFSDRLAHLLKTNAYELAFGFSKTKQFALYTTGRFDEALATSRDAVRYCDKAEGTTALPEFIFIYSLTITALIETADTRAKKELGATLRKNQNKLKWWANTFPANYRHAYLLIEAEIARLNGQHDQARSLYHQAIIDAHNNRFLHHEAIASECAANFWSHTEYEEITDLYRARAYACYSRWGATAKTKALLENHPSLTMLVASGLPGKKSSSVIDTTTRKDSSGTSSLDLGSILKATQAISGEIVLSALLEKMMKIIIENSGAQKGILLLTHDNELFVDAIGEISDDYASIQIKSVNLKDFSDIPQSIIKFAIRSTNNLILHDAMHEGSFVNDPYTQKFSPRSILCMPIIHQGRPLGLLYLENKLMTGAFTDERIEMLRVLSSQISISIENAKLYSEMEHKVRERTRELQMARDSLWGEMELAKKIQTVLVPVQPRLSGYEIIGHMDPADEVGGDYYDVIASRDMHRYPGWLIIGDVSGHGVTAGLIMMMVQTAIQTIVREYPTIKPSELIRMVNASIYYNIQNLHENKYMTLTALSIATNGTVTHAGLHQDILVYRARTQNVEQIETRGIWIGIIEDIAGINTDNEITLEKNDVLLLYTDGITESNDRDGNMFTGEKVCAILAESGDKPLDVIKQRLIYELTPYEKKDDVTMLLIKKLD